MGRIIGKKGIYPLLTQFKQLHRRSFCSSQSSSNNSKLTSVNSSDNSLNGSSLSNYEEDCKALNNLTLTSAAKIISREPVNKRKFGLDFHLVQLFFVCLPSLAVYFVAQYARSDMRKMDAELEVKKQAEFEAQAREMERKAAEEQAAVASNPEILEVKERLNKIEDMVKHFFEEYKKKDQIVKSQNEGNVTLPSPDKQKDEKN